MFILVLNSTIRKLKKLYKIMKQYKLYFQQMSLSDTSKYLQNSLNHIKSDPYNPKAIIFFLEDHLSKTEQLFRGYTKTQVDDFLKCYINYKFLVKKTLRRNNPYNNYEKMIFRHYPHIYENIRTLLKEFTINECPKYVILPLSY